MKRNQPCERFPYAHRAVIHAWIRIVSEFNQLPSVSGVLIEPAEFEAVVGELFIRPFLPFLFVIAVHASDHFSVMQGIFVFDLKVDMPFAVIGEPYSLAGVRIHDEKHIVCAVRLADGDGLDDGGRAGCPFGCGEHFLFLSSKRMISS